MDLTKLTRLELIDLSHQIKEELQNLSNREKVQTYRIFIPFVGTKRFLSKENAVNALKELIIEEAFDFLENDCVIGIDFIDKSQEKWCNDAPENIGKLLIED